MRMALGSTLHAPSVLSLLVEPVSFVDVPELPAQDGPTAGGDVMSTIMLVVVLLVVLAGCYSCYMKVEAYLHKKITNGVRPAEDTKMLLEEGAPRSSDNSPAKVRERVASDREEEEAIKARASPEK